jgi:hypothetical protein
MSDCRQRFLHDWPFVTLADFEQAEIFDEAELSNTMINKQLELNLRIQTDQKPITLRNAAELHETLDRAQVLDDERAGLSYNVNIS